MFNWQTRMRVTQAQHERKTKNIFFWVKNANFRWGKTEKADVSDTFLHISIV